MITAVIPVSPILSHPATVIIDETLDSIRRHLPDAEIIVTFDGVRPEQEHRRADYEEAIRKTLWRLDKHDKPAVGFVFDEHLHQTGMLRAVLDEITTPLLLYVEQDTPLVDRPIEFGAIARFITDGYTNLVRLYHEAVMQPEHKHLMLGVEQGFIRTCQWSQRPHVASTAFYRRILGTVFTPDAKSFIEDKMHGVCQVAYHADGVEGWRQYAMHLYNPGPDMKCSYHLDGRAGEAKFDGSQIF